MIASKRIRLREKRASDAPEDYTWHTDPELAALDATKPVTMSYERYLRDYADELQFPYPNHRRFAIETTSGKHIGNCAYYGIDEIKREAEIGIMIGDRAYWNKGYGVEAITTLVSRVFSETNLMRLHLKTLDWNDRAQKCFRKCGFTPHSHARTGKYQFVVMELHRSDWEQPRQEEDAKSLASETGPRR